MKFERSAALITMFGAVSARPDAARFGGNSLGLVLPTVIRREVPQEHSHEKFLTSVRSSLNLNNVDQVTDPVFALLGNAAAAGGAGKVTDLDCLQQRVADQAFTNAKAAGNTTAMADALVFRALERNTGGVGVASALCTETATNPEIAAVTQHQDPASDGAAAKNKQVVLTLAKQLKSIGADPQLALQSGTFAPGNKNDPTGAGNSCDDANDPIGCIYTQNLLVDDATAAEINAAVAGTSSTSDTGANSGGAATATTSAAADSCSSGSGSTASSATNAAASASSSSSTTATTTTSSGGVNVNKFTGTLNSTPVPVISSNAERPFSVNGDTFLNANAALQRACDVQFNACADVANSGGGGSVSACQTQENSCFSVNSVSKRRRRSTRLRRAALDTGSCGSPAIEFKNGLDGRTEPAFEPVNQVDFNHGSALNPGVITSFICQQLNDKCKAPQSTITKCNEGATAADAATGQAAVDAFNSALGVGGAAASSSSSSSSSASASSASTTTCA